jgi:hypothetical protein
MLFWRTVTASFGCHTTHIVQSRVESTAFEGSENALCYPNVLARPCSIWPQYLGWRSTSLGLGELTPGYCGNAFGVKKDDLVCANANFRFEGYYRR